MVRSLQDEKTKLEERLKGSDSRVRKLEDLLHRQSHLSRPSSGNFGPDFPSSPASPHLDTLSRRSSVSSRRVSMTQSPEDRALVQRIVSLEAELITEREAVQRLQKEAHTERQTNSDKYQEAQSTKKDLIGNLEARQREFEDERRYLEAEVKKCRHRNEEMEEELDKLMDSRDHERQEAEERIHQLEADLQNAHASSAEEIQRAKDLEERIRVQQEKEQELQNKVNDLLRQNDAWSQKDQDNYHALQSAFMNLAPGGSVPLELTGVIHAIEVLSEGLSIHAKTAEDNASKAMAEIKLLEEKTHTLQSQLDEQVKVFDGRDAEVTKLTEELSQVRSQLDSTKHEL
jgi:autophagy-related protein 11